MWLRGSVGSWCGRVGCGLIARAKSDWSMFVHSARSVARVGAGGHFLAASSADRAQKEDVCGAWTWAWMHRRGQTRCRRLRCCAGAWRAPVPGRVSWMGGGEQGCTKHLSARILVCFGQVYVFEFVLAVVYVHIIAVFFKKSSVCQGEDDGLTLFESAGIMLHLQSFEIL